MRPRTIEVDVQELAVSLPLGAVDMRRMAAGFENELQRLLLDRAPLWSVAADRLRAGHLDVTLEAPPGQVGAAIARSVHRAFSEIADGHGENRVRGAAPMRNGRGPGR